MTDAMPADGLQRVHDWLVTWQGRVCRAIESWDGRGAFHADRWQRPGGGGGESRVLKGGRVIEQ
ncbi:coproporphyrinogen III oxidase, partial [Halorhodospira halophila]